jgi:ATP-dependent Clp protease ATP-binding subunit ClpA
MKISRHAQAIINAAYSEARMRQHEYITPEHVLYAALAFDEVRSVLSACGANINTIKVGMETFLDQKVPLNNREPTQTVGFSTVLERAFFQSKTSQREMLEVADLLVSLYDEEQNYCAYYLRKAGIHRLELLRTLSHGFEGEDERAFSFMKGASAATVDAQDGEGGVDDGAKGKNSKKSALERYAADLTVMAREKKLEPVIGREAELDRTIQVLCRRKKNNPVHVGDSGVGKTAITEGLAQRIAAGNVPPVIKDFSVFALDMGSLVAGTRYRGDFEERVKKVLEEVLKKEKAILFIDEIHTLVGAGSASGSLDASNLLKPALTSGKLRCIGSTTHEEYNKYFDKDRALARRFQKITIDEPSEDDTKKILLGLKAKYENYHKVHYTEQAIEAAVRLSAQYINERRLPDKAIDVIDEAGAFARIGVWKESVAAEAVAGAAGSEQCVVSSNGQEENTTRSPLPATRSTAVIQAAAAEKLGRHVDDAVWEKIRAAQGALDGVDDDGADCPHCFEDDDYYTMTAPEQDAGNAEKLRTQGWTDDEISRALFKGTPFSEKKGADGAETSTTAQDVEIVEIDLPAIETVVARMAKIPEKSIGENEKDKLRYLEEKL